MTTLVAKLKANAAAYRLQIAGTLVLPHAARRLPGGETVRGGDLATAADGRIYRVEAQPEKLLHIDCTQPKAAAVAGYLLGNTHVAVEIGEGFVRSAHDPQLEAMMQAVGLAVCTVEAPFEPNLGGAGREHGHDHHPHHHPHGEHEH